MSAATELMVKYAAYHRDRRNIATHFVGIPMIVFAVGALLARPSVGVAGWPITPAAVLWGLTTLWYLTRGDLALGVAVSLANLVLILVALPLGQLDTPLWLSAGLGAFVVGWLIQFIGHYYEGKKPAFVDDLRGLLGGVAPRQLCLELDERHDRVVGPDNLHPRPRARRCRASRWR